jgi:hypothetical protein
MIIMGGAGVISVKRDATSLKTFHLTLAIVVGLLAASYSNQVQASQSSCKRWRTATFPMQRRDMFYS